MKKLLLLATISIFLAACASEKPIPEYQLIPPQKTLQINSTLHNNNNNNNNINNNNIDNSNNNSE